MKKIILGILLCLLLCLTCIAEEAEFSYIRLGDTGNIVAKLQKVLDLREWDDDADAALWGEECAAALSALQIDWEIEDTDGVLDGISLFRLLEIEAEDSEAEKLVWIPMHGGKKYHSKATCSGMIDSRQMPELCAQWLELTPCGRCYKKGLR